MDVGARWPVHATSTGKCLLAHMSETLRGPLLRPPLKRFTDKTVTDPNRLLGELEKIRAAGFSTAREEIEYGYVALAAEVRDSLGEVEGAISIGGPTSRLTRQRVEELSVSLRAAADRLSARHRATASDMLDSS